LKLVDLTSDEDHKIFELKSELDLFKNTLINKIISYNNGIYKDLTFREVFERIRIGLNELKKKSETDNFNINLNNGEVNIHDNDQDKIIKKYSAEHFNNLPVIIQRYDKLINEFYDVENNSYSTTKISEILDNLQYDIKQGNINKDYSHIISKVYEDCYILSKYLFIPLEYGFNIKDRFCTSTCILYPFILRLLNIFNNIKQSKNKMTNILKTDYID